MTKFRLEVLTGKVLSFGLEFIHETGEKVFCSQMQIELKSCITLFITLLYLVDLSLNKLKSKFNNIIGDE